MKTGHIVYKVGNTLFAVPFDVEKLQVTGGPVSVVEGGTQYFISDSGTLVYIPVTADGSASDQRMLVWVDRNGREEPINAAPKDYRDPRISPDGKRLALKVDTAGNEDIWIWDLVRETLTRLTYYEGDDYSPLWTPDGKQIVYGSESGAGSEINSKAADGAAEVEKITSEPNNPGPAAWSKDGKTLLLWELFNAPFRGNISMMSLEGDHARKPLLKGKYAYSHPRLSPDGRWLAYSSNESGEFEVYARPYPEIGNGKRQISSAGGNSPLWSPDGKEIFYRAGESAMAVSVESGSIFKCGKPRMLFQGKYPAFRLGQLEYPLWDISPDGKRFLMMKSPSPTGTATNAAAERPRINIVVNWTEELKQRVPTK